MYLALHPLPPIIVMQRDPKLSTILKQVLEENNWS
jgi:hypothetical protein